MKFRFFIYHTLWRVTLFLANRFRHKLPPKLKAYLNEREIPQIIWRRQPQSQQRRIWFHAASGEIEYIRPILRLWKQTHPNDLLILTYFSTSARSIIRNTPELDAWSALPFDLPEYCEPFLKTLNPSILIISRTDLWPTLLSSLPHIPKILVASTWAKGSKKTTGLGLFMTRWCLKYINKVCVVTKADADVVHQIAPLTLIATTGDPRFDQVTYRLNQRRGLPPNLKSWCQTKQVLIAGSTWPEDEDVIMQSWSQLRVSHIRLLLVPHETDEIHLQSLTHKLKSLGLAYTRWSEINEEDISTTILVFDKKGWLADLYSLADIAFIGGSFKKQVHSVMEALGCGLPVLVGPHYFNNREAIEFSELQVGGTTFVTSVKDSESLTHRLKKHWQTDLEEVKTLRSAILSAFQQRCQATIKTFEEIQKCL